MKTVLLLISISVFAQLEDKRGKTYALINKLCSKSIVVINDGYQCSDMSFKFDKFNNMTVKFVSQEYHYEEHDQYSLKKSHAVIMKDKLKKYFQKTPNVDDKINQLLKEN